MKYSAYVKSGTAVLLALALVVGFQNCARDFNSSDYTGKSKSSGRQMIDDVAFYKLQKGSSGEVTVTAPWGAWNGFIATTGSRFMLQGKRAHILEFEFNTPDYFTAANIGHFAVGIRGDSQTDYDGDAKEDLVGRGVVIGNVSGYSTALAAEGCTKSPSPNRVTIESYWAGNNCVFGATTSSPVLQNNKDYKLVVRAEEPEGGGAIQISYSLSQYSADQWQLIQYHKIEDSQRSTANRNLAGWFIAEVFSSHMWTMNIKNLKTYQE